jgi:hypothetical protein
MINFGHQTLVIGQQNTYQTGVGWAYLTVINESPFLLTLSFSGVGSIDFPAWFQGDVPVPFEYTGQLTMNPINYLGITQLVSQLVSVNGWVKGEISNPQWTALSQNFGNVVTTTATQTINDNFPAGTTVVEATQQGNNLGSNVKILNTGEFILQEYTGSVLNTLAHVTPNASPGTTDVALGKAGNNTEIIGYFLADHAAQFNSDFTVNGNTSLGNVVQSGGLGVAINNSYSPSIDLENATGAMAIQLGAGAIKSIAGRPLVLATQAATDSVQLQVNNANVLQLLAAAVNFSQALNSNAPFATRNGNTSGSASLYMPFIGTQFKAGMLFLSNYKDTTITSLSFPQAFTTVIMLFCFSDIGISGDGGIGLLKAGVAQSIGIVTTLSGAGGGNTNQTALYKLSLGNCPQAVDAVQLLAHANAHTGTVFFAGI